MEEASGIPLAVAKEVHSFAWDNSNLSRDGMCWHALSVFECPWKHVLLLHLDKGWSPLVLAHPIGLQLMTEAHSFVPIFGCAALLLDGVFERPHEVCVHDSIGCPCSGVLLPRLQVDSAWIVRK